MLNTNGTLDKFASIMYYPWLVLRQPKEDFTFTWNWKTRTHKPPSQKVRGYLTTTAILSVSRLASFPPSFSYLEICRTKACVWKFLLIKIFNLPQVVLQQYPLQLWPAAPAKYLSYFTKAKEDVMVYFLLRKITGITLLLWKSTKPNLLVAARVGNKTTVQLTVFWGSCWQHLLSWKISNS